MSAVTAATNRSTSLPAFASVTAAFSASTARTVEHVPMRNSRANRVRPDDKVLAFFFYFSNLREDDPHTSIV